MKLHNNAPSQTLPQAAGHAQAAALHFHNAGPKSGSARPVRLSQSEESFSAQLAISVFVWLHKDLTGVTFDSKRRLSAHQETFE
jgi:hypothetical protein